MIITREEYLEIKKKIDLYLQEEYKINSSKAKFEDLLDDKQLAIYKKYLSTTSKSDIKEFEIFLSKFNNLNILVGFKPISATKTKVQEYLSNISTENIIVSFTYKKSILAGAALEYKGIYKDYSFTFK